MNTPRDYWSESISNAAEECGVALTSEQLAYIAKSVEGAHDNYGMAFYSPPACDGLRAEARRIAEHHASTVKRLENQLANMDKAIRMALKLPDHAIIAVNKYGYVEASVR